MKNTKPSFNFDIQNMRISNVIINKKYITSGSYNRGIESIKNIEAKLNYFIMEERS